MFSDFDYKFFGSFVRHKNSLIEWHMQGDMKQDKIKLLLVDQGPSGHEDTVTCHKHYV